MNKIYCFKSIPDSAYGKAMKEYFELLPLWADVVDRVGELLGKEITKMAHEVEELWIDTDEVDKETAKLFTKDGKLKKNSKLANNIRKEYLKIVEDVGLKDFKDTRYINFVYGVMRTSRQQTLESFRSSENDIYFKADFDLLGREKSNGSIEPISQIQYEEKYLEELKKRESDRVG